MAVSVVASTTTLDTTVPRVPVTARWAPITSLFMRLMRAPVCVRVKKASGMRCTWSNSSMRRSKMSPSPMRDDHHRSKNESAAVATAAATMKAASTVTRWRSPLGMTSTICLNSSTGTSAIRASSTMITKYPINIVR